MTDDIRFLAFLNYANSGDTEIILHTGERTSLTLDLLLDLKIIELRQCRLILKSVGEMSFVDCQDICNMHMDVDKDFLSDFQETFNSAQELVRSKGWEIVDFLRQRGYIWPYMNYDLKSNKIIYDE